MQNEQLAGNEALQEEERNPLDYKDLQAVESVVNEYARTVAARYGIPGSFFTVHLVFRSRGVMTLQAGPVVHIYLLWPDAQHNINTLLRHAFDTIKKHNMRRSCEIVPAALIRQHKMEHKKLIKQAFGNDIGNIIPEMLAKTRVRMEIDYTYTMRDVKTGLTVSRKSSELGYISHHDAEITLRLELSRKVAAQFPQVQEVEEVTSETPELDSVINHNG